MIAVIIVGLGKHKIPLKPVRQESSIQSSCDPTSTMTATHTGQSLPPGNSATPVGLRC